MKGFTATQRTRLTTAAYLMITTGLTSPSCLSQILNEHLVKDGIGLEFARSFFRVWLKEKEFSSLISNLKKAEIDGKLLVSSFTTDHGDIILVRDILLTGCYVPTTLYLMAICVLIQY